MKMKDPLIIPHLQVDSEHVYKEQQVQIRCNTEDGSHCHFYTDHSEVPFRSEKRRFKACLITVFGGELLEKRADQSRAEVFLSCAVELMMEGKNVSSQRSEKIKIGVSDEFRRLQIQVDPARVTAEQKARIRCEADRGTRCHFYTDQSEVPFRSEPYIEKYKICVLSVSGRELLRERGRSPRAEMSVSCAVELETRSEAVISQRSEEISIEVEGLVESEEPTTTCEALEEDQIYQSVMSNKGSLCHFYTDGSQVPFRSVPFRTEYQHCHLSVSAEELLEERGSQLRTEVSVSCAVELTMDGEPNIIHYSDSDRDSWFSKFGRPRVEVDPQLVNEDNLIRVLCLAGTGMCCFFYNGNNKMPFNAVVFNETSKACSLTVLGKDLPSEGHRGSSSETLLSCAVEAKLGESTVKSRRSESVKVEVVGKG
ncbi:uncharacterized protein LOC136758326 [Amia ocellicauda]|uniref:uncharacterized protein LOC136758326 n=1 Tax=Amia ocellicauda TaxID=2972642 RepID=UPI003464BE94